MKDTKERLFEMMNRVAGMSLLNESEMLYEINLDTLFTDLENKLTCIDPKEFGEYLNFLAKRQKMSPSKRPSVDPNKPWVHASTIHNAGDPRLVKVRGKKGEEGKWKELKFRDLGSLNLSGEEYEEIVDKLGDFDVERFIKEITQEPINIIDANDKMAKSSTEDSVTYNTGVPAFKGLVYNKAKNQFMYVSTCPGAGSCVKPCYARHGNYIKYPNPYLRATQILNLLLNEPERYEEKMYNELKSLCEKHGKDKTVYMRWNDSGDFFTETYLNIAMRITDRLVKEGYNVKSYAHTKVADTYLKQTPNFIVTFSSNAHPKEIDKLKDAGVWKTAKTSNFLPLKYFHDLLKKKTKRNGEPSNEYDVDENGKVQFIHGEKGLAELKRRIAEEAYPQYEMKPESILTYDEMMKVPPREGVFWNVVVMPTGDGDIEARRPDVRKIFLSQH